MRYFMRHTRHIKGLCCLFSVCLLTGCSSSTSVLLREKETQPDIWGTEAETIAEQNGVPVDYISDTEPSFPSATLSMPALHVLALSNTTFCSIFLSGSDAILVGAGAEGEAQSIISYLDALSVKRCVLLLPDLTEATTGGLSELLEGLGDRISTVVLPIVSTDEFTASVFDSVAERYPITIPTEGLSYPCLGYTIEFFYPYGKEPASADNGFAIRITGSDISTMLLSGNDPIMLDTLVSEKELTADIVINYSGIFDTNLYQVLGGRYAYTPFDDSNSINVRSQNQFAQQYQSVGYSLSRPDSDGSCVYLFGNTISMRTHVGEETTDTLQQKPEETTLNADMTVFFDGTYYHRSAGCSYINTADLLREIPLQTAEDNDYQECPYCWANGR